MALDVGTRRIGIAVASREAALAQPLTALIQGEEFFRTLEQLIKKENVDTLVVGLPRGLDGQTTDQTRSVQDFTRDLRKHFKDITVYLQDEAVTSKQAEAELEARGKPYARGDVDALAATYILEDWLAGQHKVAG